MGSGKPPPMPEASSGMRQAVDVPANAQFLQTHIDSMSPDYAEIALAFDVKEEQEKSVTRNAAIQSSLIMTPYVQNNCLLRRTANIHMTQHCCHSVSTYEFLLSLHKAFALFLTLVCKSLASHWASWTVTF